MSEKEKGAHGGEVETEIDIVEVEHAGAEPMDWGGVSLKRQISGSPTKPTSKKVAALEEEAALESEAEPGLEGAARDARDLEEATLEMLTLGTLIEGWARQELEKKRIGKESAEVIGGLVRNMHKSMRDVQRTIGRIEGRQEGRSEVMAMVRRELQTETAGFKKEFGGIRRELRGAAAAVSASSTGASSSSSYAEKLKLPARSAAPPESRELRRRSAVTLVYPKTVTGTEKECSQALMAELRRDVRPSASGFTVDRVREIRGGGLLIAVPAGAANEKLQQQPFFRRPDVVCRPVEGRLPRLLIYDVPAGLSEAEVADAVFLQNTEELQTPVTPELRASFRLLFKSGPRRDDAANWVAECAPVVRTHLVERGFVCLEWSRCRVRDYAQVSRCFQCHRYGHTSKNCRSPQCCGHCAADGHNFRNCPNKETVPATCINCKRFGKPHAHAVTDAQCPVYLRSLEGEIRRTDYGL